MTSSRIEEMITAAVPAAQARRALTDGTRFGQWVAPHVSVRALALSPSLAPGDRFQIDAPGTPTFDYLVEAVSDREVVFSFTGAWRGRERWSFIADGADTIVRRTYEVDDANPIAELAWRTLGRPLVTAHFKWELARFRDLAMRGPSVRAEIEASPTAPPSFPIDDG
ncbi:MAG: SRPBCC family protein [Gemmatimonadaceae bacterium]